MSEQDKEYFVKMLDEMRVLREKYGIPKGMAFVPDRIEVSLKRNSYDNFHLFYKEYFDYLPSTVLDSVIPITINMLVQNAIPRELIQRIANNGVGLELDGNATMIMATIISELSVQKRFTEEEVANLIGIIKRIRQAFTDISDMQFEWNDEIAERYFKILQQTAAIAMANPSVLSEMEAIPKKYAESAEKAKAILGKKDNETKPQ